MAAERTMYRLNLEMVFLVFNVFTIGAWSVQGHSLMTP